MPTYDDHYVLQEAFQREPELIPRVELYDFDPQQLYAAIMERLAQPLPNGDASPFVSKNPGSAQSVLVGALIYLQGILAHEVNLSADSTYLQMLRLMGATIRQSDPPIVTLRFDRTPQAIRDNTVAEIPIGLEIKSRFRQGVTATVMDFAQISGVDFVELPARINQPGIIDGLRDNEFSVLPPNLANISSVTMLGVASFGREPETIYEAAVRAREIFRTGNRGVTDLDLQRHAIDQGAGKANVIRGVTPGCPGYFRDLRTIVVYPTGLADTVKAGLMTSKLADERLLVVDAEVIKVDGTIDVRALSNLSDLQVFNLAAAAIRDNLNPPNGQWGDVNYIAHLSEALERVEGIYAVPSVNLKNAVTQEPIDFASMEPWQLIEIQSSLLINVIRGNA